jgi:L-iditol 2-dehydrogenase
MKKMKVAMYYKNSDVRIEEQSIPDISDEEILIKIMASGICGSDVLEWYRIKKAPLVLGHEIAGEIVKKGKNVTTFNIGDRVFSTHHVPCNTCRYCLNEQHTICHTLHTTKFYPGGFSEYVRIPAINVDRGTFLLPDDVMYDEATFIEPLACVVRGFRKACFRPAQTVIVLGSGMAGLLNIKLAKTYGASTIFATDINEYRLKKAEEMGADISINAKDDVCSILKKKNNDRLADLVILSTGSIAAAKQAFDLVEPGGTILLFAPTNPGQTMPIDLFNLWIGQISVVSTYAGSGKDILDAIELLATKRFDVTDMITHTLPLLKAQEGFNLVSKAEKSIKVILHPHEK